MDDAVTAESEETPPRARAIDDLHALSKAARIVRTALARQVARPKACDIDAEQGA